MTQIKDAVALVTGGNRGLGRAFVDQLLQKGASKVYATSRTPVNFEDDRIVNVILDLNDSDSIAALAEQTPDLSIVINNAGVISGLALETSIKDIRSTFETNVFGPVQVAQVLAPVLKKNGGGMIINVASALTWIPYGVYGATKAALWSISNALREELKSQSTQVTSLHVGYMDTDMVKEVDAPKSDPQQVAATTLENAEKGESEVLFDDGAKYAKSLVSGSVDDLHF